MVRVIRTRDLGREARGCLDSDVDGHVYTDTPEYLEQQWLLERERRDREVKYDVVHEDNETVSEIEFGDDSLTEEWDNAESDSSSGIGSDDDSNGDAYSFYEEACQEDEDESEDGGDLSGWGSLLD